MPIRTDALIEAPHLAAAADARAGVVTAPAAPDELEEFIALVEATWGPGSGPDRTSLRAAQHAGTTIVLARRDGRLLGCAFGFLGWDEGLHLHSHLAAVAPGARGGGIGTALKLRQRAMCLAHGIGEIRWTFDPLIRRNAAFNLARLGAEVRRFLPDFYGELQDAISAGDRSDRFEVGWRLDSPRVARALAREPRPAWGPVAEPFPLAPDYEALRRDDLPAALALREESRGYFGRFGEGGMRLELDGALNWVLTRDRADRAA